MLPDEDRLHSLFQILAKAVSLSYFYLCNNANHQAIAVVLLQPARQRCWYELCADGKAGGIVLNSINEKVVCQFGAAGIIATCKGRIKGCRIIVSWCFCVLKDMFFINVWGQMICHTFGSSLIVSAICPQLFHVFNQFSWCSKRGKSGFGIQLLAQPRDKKENKYHKSVKRLLTLRHIRVSTA